MKKKILALILSLFIFIFLPSNIYADIGPKPSVQIDFSGLEGETYYATLLSKDKVMGPWQVYNGEAYNTYDITKPDYPIWETFVNYADPDGYYFIEFFEDCTKTHNLSWTYYPPNTFKILLYFPETGTFVSSESYDRYAFDSYYTVNLDAADLELLVTESDSSVSQGTNQESSDAAFLLLTAEKNYDYTWELISLAVRIIATIILEIAIAWLFAYRNAPALRFISFINLITQVILNVILNITAYTSGSMAFVLNYILLEILVLVIEAKFYSKKLPKLDHRYGKGRAIGYACIANIASFVIGLQLARWIPGIF